MSGGTRRGLAKRGPATTCQRCTHEKAAESSVFPTSTRSLRLPLLFSTQGRFWAEKLDQREGLLHFGEQTTLEKRRTYTQLAKQPQHHRAAHRRRCSSRSSGASWPRGWVASRACSSLVSKKTHQKWRQFIQLAQ
jgi:hypothetical protein